MEHLWRSAPQTASELAKALRPATGWADNTVRTLLARLVEKKALRADENVAGVRQFTPSLAREAFVKSESASFLERVFRGAAKPLLVHFASQSKLTAAEVKELKRLLDESLKQQK